MVRTLAMRSPRIGSSRDIGHASSRRTPRSVLRRPRRWARCRCRASRPRSSPNTCGRRSAGRFGPEINDTRLHRRFRPCHPDRVRQAFQPVTANDQRVEETAVSELGEHRHPLLSSLPTSRPEPQAEDVTLTLEIHAYSNVDRPVSDLATPDLHNDRINKKDGIDPIEWSALPTGHIRQDSIGDLGDRLPGDFSVVDLSQMSLDLPGRQSLRIEAEYVRTESLQAPHMLRHGHGLERALTVGWHPHINRADFGLDLLLSA